MLRSGLGPRLRCTVALLALALLSAEARAADPGKAETHFKAERRHYQLSEYAQALEQFKEAYRFQEDPVFLFNIAQCHRMLGNADEALRFYRRFLGSKPARPQRDDVERIIRTLEQQQAQKTAVPPPVSSAPLASPPAAACLFAACSASGRRWCSPVSFWARSRPRPRGSTCWPWRRWSAR